MAGSLEVKENTITCPRCGTDYPYAKRKQHFFISYQDSYKNSGIMHICRKCVNEIYDMYLKQCGDPKLATRQTCRKLDLYWSDVIYDGVYYRNPEKSMMNKYIARLNTGRYVGRCYDDTLQDENMMWTFVTDPSDIITEETPVTVVNNDNSEVSNEAIEFWGSGYNPSMYIDLESRFDYHCKKLKVKRKNLDLGMELLLKQICVLELSINKDIAAGKSVDKAVNSLNTLVGSLNLKPVQKQDDINSELANTPLGVWILKYENERPLPDIDPELKANKIKKYVFTWLGHVCKMLGKENSFSKLYDDEIKRLRAENPELSEDNDNDDEFYADVLEEEDLEDLEI